MMRRWLQSLALTSLVLAYAAATPAADDLVTLSGKQLYERYCVACHGVKGRGDGPVSDSFAIEVPDLTLIARRHGGTYPRDLVERIIDGRHILGAHGTRTMPVWGEDFGRLRIGDPDAEAATRTITLRLADYVWLLQRPDAGDQQTRP
ncbi:c-type cytochrome [Povalibacter sp.]|uniref:c-type cytochrome n=1 Tax=Povalibacter sp. TaxID=1962978 RepID=UPI002F40D098